MIERTCLTRESDLHLSLLYYLPANPVGFEVEIRDKADGVENALCPTKQSDV